MTDALTVERIFSKLNDRFNPENASGLAAVFQFQLTDASSFYLDVNDSTLSADWGEHADPDITLHLSEAVLGQVVSGELDGMSAFLKGQLRAEGNLMLATRLGKLFKA